MIEVHLSGGFVVEINSIRLIEERDGIVEINGRKFFTSTVFPSSVKSLVFNVPAASIKKIVQTGLWQKTVFRWSMPYIQMNVDDFAEAVHQLKTAIDKLDCTIMADKGENHGIEN